MAKVHGVATRVYDLWATDLATEPWPWLYGNWRRARFLPGRRKSEASAVQGFCTRNRATGPLRPGPAGRTTTGLWIFGCSEPWPRLYAPRPTLPSSPWPSLVSATAFGSGRRQASARSTSASRTGSISMIARPKDDGSLPGWEHGRSDGDKPCRRAGSSNVEPNTCHYSRRQSLNAVCTSFRGAPHGRESLGTAGGGSLRQPWLRSEPPSLPYASGTGGHRNDMHGSTQSQGRNGNLSSRTKPPGRTQSQALPHCPYPRSSSGPHAPSGGAQPLTLQPPLLSSWSTLVTRGTTPTMGYWEPLARIVEWPLEIGNAVRVLRAASKTKHGPRVLVRGQLRTPKVSWSRNRVLSTDCS